MDGDTRATIRGVALELFSTKGFDQTSLREIAERVGLTKASLYYHYSSKQALLIAVVEPVITGWRTVADDTAALAHTPANVRQVIARCLDVLLHHRAVAGIFQKDPAGVAVVAGALWEDMLELSQRLCSWLAGPSALATEQLRAVAAMEVLGAALTSGTYLKQEIVEDEMRTVLLDAALDVLHVRAEPEASGLRKLG
jgi:AcrR family transcriptional regulator